MNSPYRMGPALFNSISTMNAVITDCDKLAANPPDPDRIVPGVSREQIDLPRALEACRAAVAEHPDAGRLAYQLGRCFFYAGQTAEALASFREAASLGYRQAHFILGLVMMRRSEGVSFNLEQIENHWRAAARLDHANAQVSYVREALKGTFKGIPGCPARDELKRFLEHARPKVDYLGGLLVDDLMTALV
jgi:TPR repeat protein